MPKDRAIVERRDGDCDTGTSHPDWREPGPHHGILRSHWDILLVVSAGGALGSLSRWGVGELVPWPGKGFPWATFIENVSGGLVLGVMMVFLLEVWPPRRYLRPFLGVGVLGGYTTFSTYMLEARDLLVGGQEAIALTYLAGSLGAVLAAVWLGILCARAAVRAAHYRRRHKDAPHPTNPATERRSAR